MHTEALKVVDLAVLTVQHEHTNPCDSHPSLWQPCFRDSIRAVIWNPQSQVICRLIVDVRATQLRSPPWIDASGGSVLALSTDSIVRCQTSWRATQLPAVGSIPLFLNLCIIRAQAVCPTCQNDRQIDFVYSRYRYRRCSRRCWSVGGCGGRRRRVR